RLLDDLAEALDRIAKTGHFQVLAIRSAKPTSFCHGVPLSLLAARSAPEQIVALSQRGQALCEKIARLPIPSVAIIGGACLGAGLELALACDHRVVLDRPSVTLGFPEISLGLIPCWGGTQRLPRVVGVENSLPLLTAGRRLSARAALACGL